MNKVKVFLVGLLAVVILAACGSKESGDTIGKIGDKDITGTDFIEMFEENLDADDIQSIYLSEILNEYENKDYEKLFMESYRTEALQATGEEMDEEDEEYYKEVAKQDASMAELLLKSNIVTKEDIDKTYKENNQAYLVDVLTYEEGIEGADDLLDIAEKDTEDIKKKVEDYENGVEFFDGMLYTELNKPERFPDKEELKEGEILVQDHEGVTFIIKVNKVMDLKKEEIEPHIILDMLNDKVGSFGELLDKLDKEGSIELSKELRGYLKVDEYKLEEGEE